ncbi:hypothetical protein ACPDHL_11290 [Myroides sp. C15-4]|uniref:hypothetical protein n=1 Tax=Myroides sp. C15-4 TaxID=3400532 RepID=UPI003D2F89AA
MIRTKKIFQTIIEDIDRIYEKLNKDNSSDNFFSMSAKAYYENPFTKILSFILSDTCKSNFREVILEELLNGICVATDIDLLKANCKVKLEHRTLEGNRIDLILYNENIVVAIEVKINHVLNNPLDDYETEINRYFPHVDNKKFLILSYKEEKESGLWKFVSIKETFDNIFDVINGQLKSSSWDYYITDFINHFKNKDIYIMEQEDIDFIGKNFITILKSKKVLDITIKNIANKILEDASLASINIINKDWGENEIAIRAYPLNDLSNVTLVFSNDTKFYISVYYYIKDTAKRVEILNEIGSNKFSSHEDKTDYICYKLNDSEKLSDINEAIEVTMKQIKIMKTFFPN